VLGLAAPQAREVGGAGVPGYDDEKCESLERDLQSALDRVIDLLRPATPRGPRAIAPWPGTSSGRSAKPVSSSSNRRPGGCAA
jgi:hypothetical protein